MAASLRHACAGFWLEPMLDVLVVLFAVDLVALALVDLEGLDGIALCFDALFEAQLNCRAAAPVPPSGGWLLLGP
jgi:hypothetical protein